MTKNNDSKQEFSRAKIKVGYTCNNDCSFCECRSLRKISDPTTKQIAKKIQLASQKGFEMVLFSGGEPTLRSDLPKLIALAKRFKMRSGLVSNGRRLANEGYTKLLKAKGLSWVQLSIHGSNKTHNKITRANSYQETIKALSVLKKLDIKVLVNLVITKQNLTELLDIGEMLFKYAPLTFKLSAVEPVNLDDESFEKIVPDLSQTRLALGKLFSHFDTLSNPDEFKIVAAGLPLCILSAYADRSYDLRRFDLAEVAECYDMAFKNTELLGRVRPVLCEQCKLYDNCPGVYEEYISKKGTLELKPELRPISNSFAYVTDEPLKDFEITNCPLLKNNTKIDEPERKIIFTENHKTSIYRSNCKDFDANQLLDTKLTLGQIYLDISGKPFHEDFQSDMQKLELHQKCASCKKLSHCPGYFKTVSHNVFITAENELKDIIGKLSGKVLDVGGGPVRYPRQFGELIKNHKMDYFVVEPDPNPVLNSFLSAHNIAENIFVGRIEDWQTKPASLDWVLVLRSHNHLSDLDLAYFKMASWLKPGGRILLVDNTVYGVLRSKKVWERIAKKGGIAHFEHFNNHTATQAIPYLERAGLTLIDSHEVSPNTANQWWCVFKK